MIVRMDDWLTKRSPQGKDVGSPSPSKFLRGGITEIRELLDLHKQLRHEACGLRDLVALKQVLWKAD